MIKISGLWLNTSPKGEKFFTGNFGTARIVIFKNGFKEEGAKDPDYFLYIDEQTKKDKPTIDTKDPFADDVLQ